MFRSFRPFAFVAALAAVACMSAVASPPITTTERTTVAEKTTLQEYLAADMALGISDHHVRAQRDAASGDLHLMIYPARTSGRTLDYRVEGNRLVQLHTGAHDPADASLPAIGPRITAQMVEDAIDSEYYQVVPGTTMTTCALTLSNGFVVIGQNNCVSPQNWKADLGRQFARQDAGNKVFELLGFELRGPVIQKTTA